MYALIDENKNVISVGENYPIIPNTTTVLLHDIEDSNLLSNTILIFDVDVDGKPTSNSNLVIPQGWKYIDEKFILSTQPSLFDENLHVTITPM